MEIGNLSIMVSVLVALSIASERLVEILKGLSDFLNKENPIPKKERLRRVALQTLAVLAGILTTLLAYPAIKDVMPKLSSDWTGIIALGLLASGGSGFWNSILGYLLSVKDIKKVEATRQKKAIS